MSKLQILERQFLTALIAITFAGFGLGLLFLTITTGDLEIQKQALDLLNDWAIALISITSLVVAFFYRRNETVE